ncbi:MAG: hypothetical protein OXU94_03685 [Gammaproteobacteria bacterium]|nr:hypothetical protein [Gammaproteobacteria bacterium]
MTANFDAIEAAEKLTQAGFSDRQAKAVAGSIAKSRSGMATKEDVAHCWRVILGIILPFLVLILGVLLTR